MLCLNKRIELEKQYYAWIKDLNLDDKPSNVIVFACYYDLIDEENVTKFLKFFEDLNHD